MRCGGGWRGAQGRPKARPGGRRPQKLKGTGGKGGDVRDKLGLLLHVTHWLPEPYPSPPALQPLRACVYAPSVYPKSWKLEMINS